MDIGIQNLGRINGEFHNLAVVTHKVCHKHAGSVVSVDGHNSRPTRFVRQGELVTFPVGSRTAKDVLETEKTDKGKGGRVVDLIFLNF